MPVINENSANHDQTPCSAASDLSPHCLSMSHLWDARHNWINPFNPEFLKWTPPSLNLNTVSTRGLIHN